MNYNDGKPYVKIYSDDNIEIDKYDINVSITHDKVNAIAIVIIEERG